MEIVERQKYARTPYQHHDIHCQLGISLLITILASWFWPIETGVNQIRF